MNRTVSAVVPAFLMMLSPSGCGARRLAGVETRETVGVPEATKEIPWEDRNLTLRFSSGDACISDISGLLIEIMHCEAGSMPPREMNEDNCRGLRGTSIERAPPSKKTINNLIYGPGRFDLKITLADIYEAVSRVEHRGDGSFHPETLDVEFVGMPGTHLCEIDPVVSIDPAGVAAALGKSGEAGTTRLHFCIETKEQGYLKYCADREVDPRKLPASLAWTVRLMRGSYVLSVGNGEVGISGKRAFTVGDDGEVTHASARRGGGVPIAAAYSVDARTGPPRDADEPISMGGLLERPLFRLAFVLERLSAAIAKDDRAGICLALTQLTGLANDPDVLSERGFTDAVRKKEPEILALLGSRHEDVRVAAAMALMNAELMDRYVALAVMVGQQLNFADGNAVAFKEARRASIVEYDSDDVTKRFKAMVYCVLPAPDEDLSIVDLITSDDEEDIETGFAKFAELVGDDSEAVRMTLYARLLEFVGE